MILDFILIFSIVFSVFTGFRKGFSQMLLSGIFLIFSIAIVSGIYSYMGDYIFETSYFEEAHESVSASIEEYITKTEDNLIEHAPYLSLLGLRSDSSEKMRTEITNKIALKIIKTLLAIPMLILSYFILRIIMFFLRKILKKTTSIPIIYSIDAIFGGVCGLFIGVVLAGLIYFATSCIYMIPSFEIVREQFSSSLISMLINDFIF